MKRRIVAWIMLVAILLSILQTAQPVFADSELSSYENVIDREQQTTNTIEASRMGIVEGIKESRTKEQTVEMTEESGTREETIEVTEESGTKEQTVEVAEESGTKEQTVEVAEESGTKEQTVEVTEESGTMEQTVEVTEEREQEEQAVDATKTKSTEEQAVEVDVQDETQEQVSKGIENNMVEGQDVTPISKVHALQAIKKGIGVVFAQREWASGHYVWYVNSGSKKHYIFCLEKGKTMKSGLFDVSKHSGIFGTKENTFRITCALNYFYSKGGWSSEEGYVDTQYAIWNQRTSDIAKQIMESSSHLWKLTELNSSRSSGSSSYSKAIGGILQSETETAKKRKALEVPSHKVYVDPEKRNGYNINSIIKINGSAWKYYADSNHLFSSGIEVVGCYDSQGELVDSNVANASVSSDGSVNVHVKWDSNQTIAKKENPMTVIMRVNSDIEGSTSLDYLQTEYDEKTQTLSYDATFSSPAYFAFKVYCDSDTIPTGIHINKVDEFGNPVSDVLFHITGRNSAHETLFSCYFRPEEHIVLEQAGTYYIVEADQPDDLIRYKDPDTGNPNIAIIQVDEVVENSITKLIATCTYKGGNVIVSDDSLTYTVPNDYYDGSAYMRKIGNIFVSYENGRFVYKKRELENISFDLYAAENIYAGETLLFKTDQLITNEVLNSSVWNTIGQHNARIGTRTNGNGEIQYENLPVGHYYLVERDTPYEGYWVEGARISFKILPNQMVPILQVPGLEEGEYINNPVYADCLIKKENDEGEPLSNAEFTLYAHISNKNFDGYNIFTAEQTRPAVIKRTNGVETVEKNQWIPLETMKTNENGEAFFEMALPYGRYMVVETYPPNTEGVHYSLSDEVYQFEHTIKNNDEFTSGMLFTHTFMDTEKSNFILIRKTGEQLVDAKEVNSQYGNYKELVFDKIAVENIEFYIYNSDHQLVERLLTDKNGEAKSKNLQPGIYYVEEINNGGIMKKDSSKKKIVLEQNETETIQMKEVEFYNEAIDTSLHIYKKVECASLSEGSSFGVSACDTVYQYSYQNVSDVLFGIFTREDIKNAQGITIVKAGSCVGYGVTNQEGVASFTNRLVNGNYYWKELKAASDVHMVNQKEFDFTIQLQGEDVEMDLNSKDTPLLNDMYKGSIRVIKTDGVSEQRLEGVMFTLHDAMSNVLGEFVTDANGEIYIGALPMGHYYLKETKTLQDYVLEENTYTIDLTKSNLEQIITITNQKFDQNKEDEETKKTVSTKGKAKTGDESNIYCVLLLLFVASAVFVGVLKINRKDDEYDVFETFN